MIIVTSLVGNSLILVVIYKTPNLRKPMNYFVANMAVSDLLNRIQCPRHSNSFTHEPLWVVTHTA